MDQETTVVQTPEESATPEVKSVIFPMTGFRYQNMRTAADDWLRTNRGNIEVVFSRYKIVLDDEAMTKYHIYRFVMALEIFYTGEAVDPEPDEPDDPDDGDDEGDGDEDEKDPQPEPQEPEPDSKVDDQGSFKDAISAATDGDEIELAANIDITSNLTIDKDITINLNGNDLTCENGAYLVASGSKANLVIDGVGKIDGGSGRAIQAQSGASVTIGKDITVESTFTAAVVLSGANLVVSGTVNNGSKNGIQAQKDSTVVVDGGSITGGDYGVKALSGSSVEIKSGEIVGKTGAIYGSSTGKITIGGGTVDGTDGFGVAMFDSVALTVNGGTVKGTGAVTINGGAENGAANITIKNGNFEGSVVGAYVANGTMTVENGTISGPVGIMVRGGVLNVTGGNIRAIEGDKDSYEIGDTRYEVPAAAIAIDKHSSYSAGRVDVKISGGTISATDAEKCAIVYTDTGVVQEELPEGVVITTESITGKVTGNKTE